MKRKLKQFILYALILLTGSFFAENSLGATSSLTYKKGLLFNYGPDIFTMKLSGYIIGDAIKFSSNSNLLNNGTNLRYARLSLSGKFLPDWKYAFSYSLSESLWKNANISYHGWHNMYFKIGQFLPDFTLANWASNTNINFLEVGLPTEAFDSPYSCGVNYGIYNKIFSATASIFSDSIEKVSHGKNPLGGTARLIYSPIHTTTRAVHFAISNWLQRPDGSNSIRFGTIPEAKSPKGDQLLDTGTIKNTRYFNATAFETACVYGSCSAQAEYIINQINRKNTAPNLFFSGYYLTASYFLTGESRAYNFPGGGFTGITPIQNKKYGAFQVLARLSRLNLNDRTVQGGKETNITAGLNWYLNSFITLKFNLIRALARPAFNGKNINTTIYAARIQIQS
jgi:phosphate-selective porin OprO/OprP